MDPQIIRLPFTRIDERKRMVWGYASTGRVDTYDTIFEPSWWPQAITGYKERRTISEMHLDLYGEPMWATGREPMVVGTVPILECDERGLWIGAEIRNDDTWEKITSGEYNGFSIAAMPYEYREETVNGRKVIRFTQYLLQDITVGYPAANLDARFQLVERLEEDADSPWDWDWGADADAIINQLGWAGMKQACLYQDPDKDPETKAAYKLPVAKMKAGKLTVYFNGVRAAMAALNGARGEMNLSENERKKIYTKIKKLYARFGKEAPELRLDEGGNAMSKFVDEVKALAKRLLGKEPDEATMREIGEMETRLADDRTKQVETLTGTVAKLTERLDALEKKDVDNAAATDPNAKKLDDLGGTVAKLTERIDAVEKAAAVTQQPGESGKDGGAAGTDMNRLIRGRLGVK